MGLMRIANRVLPNIHNTLLPKKASGKVEIRSASQEL
ncbi:hypothetical protein LINPERPRIM_LOCUS14922 [Linum perenne]